MNDSKKHAKVKSNSRWGTWEIHISRAIMNESVGVILVKRKQVMKIATRNIRGLGNSGKRRIIKDYIGKHK